MITKSPTRRQGSAKNIKTLIQRLKCIISISRNAEQNPNYICRYE